MLTRPSTALQPAPAASQRPVPKPCEPNPPAGAWNDEVSTEVHAKWGLHLGTLERSLLMGYRQGGPGSPARQLGSRWVLHAPRVPKWRPHFTQVGYPFDCPRRVAPLLLGVSGRQHHNGWGSGTAFGRLGQ